MAGQLEGVLNDFGLLVRRQAVHFFDHFGCCHESNSCPAMGELQVSAVKPNSRKQRYPLTALSDTDHTDLHGGTDPSGVRMGFIHHSEEGTCPKSVGPIPAVLGQRSEGAQAEEQETTDDGHESHRNRMETAGG